MALGKTVAALLDEIDAAELIEWVAFAELEPFGGRIEDLRAGLGPAVAANMNRDANQDPLEPLDFFPWHAAPKKIAAADSDEVIAQKLRAALGFPQDG